MSEDYHDKTEEPTPKRLAEARKKGYAAKSQDLIVSFHLIMCVVIFYLFADGIFGVLADVSVNIWNHLNFQYADLSFLSSLLDDGLVRLLYILLPIIAGGLLIAISLNILQTGGLFSFYPLIPKWSNLNLFNPSNYERILGLQAFVKLGFSLVRLQLVLILCVFVVGQNAFQVFSLGKVSLPEMLAFIKRECLLVAFSLAISYLGVAVCDFFYQKWSFTRKMRMSKREVKDEFKQGEGDPTVKSKIRNFMLDSADQHVIQDLSSADLIIFDGVREVIAINYKLYAKPYCLDKGTSRKGLIMLERAKAISVPIISNPDLAHRLYRDTEIRSFIKSEYYQELVASLAEGHLL